MAYWKTTELKRGYTERVESMPILGWKYLIKTRGDWYSPFMSYRWTEEVQKAMCEHCSKDELETPNQNCDCGIYGFHQITDAINWASVANDNAIVVGIAGWGKICVHEDSWRSEFAQILGVLDSGNPEGLAGKAAKDLNIVALKESLFLQRLNEEAQTIYKHGIPPTPLARTPWLNWSIEEMFEKIERLDLYLDERDLEKEVFDNCAFEFGFRWEKGGIRQCHVWLITMQNILIRQIAQTCEKRGESFVSYPVLNAKGRRAVLLNRTLNGDMDMICSRLHGIVDEREIFVALNFVHTCSSTLSPSEKRLYGVS